MPHVDDNLKKGDLIIRFKIAFPAYLPRVSKNLIKKALNVCKLLAVSGESESINLRIIMDQINRKPSYDFFHTKK